MTKKISWITLFLLAGFLLIFLLPSTKIVTQSMSLNCPIDVLTRNITNQSNWNNWWPGKKLSDSTYLLNTKKIYLNNILLTGFKAQTISGENNVQIDFQMRSTSLNTSQIDLITQYEFSSNIFTKAIQYIKFYSDKKLFSQLLIQLQTVFSSVEKIYGFKIEKQKVPNSSYISVKQSFKHYPTTEEVYTLIQELKRYIFLQNSKEVNMPILHIHANGENDYEAMVAIATDRDLPSTNRYFLKNMMLGNILVAEVRGDQKKIEQCTQAMKYYISDYRKSSPAISFERLITNRLVERDSTKWITTINFPIFN